jgi:hypothetical protein
MTCEQYRAAIADQSHEPTALEIVTQFKHYASCRPCRVLFEARSLANAVLTPITPEMVAEACQDARKLRPEIMRLVTSDPESPLTVAELGELEGRL